MVGSRLYCLADGVLRWTNLWERRQRLFRCEAQWLRLYRMLTRDKVLLIGIRVCMCVTHGVTEAVRQATWVLVGQRVRCCLRRIEREILAQGRVHRASVCKCTHRMAGKLVRDGLCSLHLRGLLSIFQKSKDTFSLPDLS